MRSSSFSKVFHVARRAVSQQAESEILCSKETHLGNIALLGLCYGQVHRQMSNSRVGGS